MLSKQESLDIENRLTSMRRQTNSAFHVPRLHTTVRPVLLAAAVFLATALLSTTNAAARMMYGRIHEDGRAVAARLYIQSSDGKTWYHATSSTETGESAVTYRKKRGERSTEIHTSLPAGNFQVDLPPGEYTFTVERGKEYRPVSKKVIVPDGDADTAVIEIRLKRWIHMAELGWYSGDTHVHRSLQDVPVAMLADDLNLAFPLTYWVTAAHESPTSGAKSTDAPPGNRPEEIAPGYIVYPLNTEYELFTYGGKRHTLGAVFVLGHQTPLEIPAPRVTPIANEARKQKALLDLDKHTWAWSAMIVPIMKVDLFELANNHIWRTEFAFHDWTINTLPTDWGIETDENGGWTEHGWIDFGFKTYYAFLNCGFDIKPTGGTATGVHPVPLGFGRVYVEVEGKLTYDKWFEGLGNGKSFVTTGPMLMMKFDGRPAGTKFPLKQSNNPSKCHVTGIAVSETPLSRIEILVNGDVVKTIKPGKSPTDRDHYRVTIDEVVSFDDSAWVAVRCFQPRDDGRYFYAHTGPVHYQTAGAPLRPKVREVRYLLNRVQEEITRNTGVLTNEELEEFKQAELIYKKLLERAR